MNLQFPAQLPGALAHAAVSAAALGVAVVRARKDLDDITEMICRYLPDGTLNGNIVWDKPDNGKDTLNGGADYDTFAPTSAGEALAGGEVAASPTAIHRPPGCGACGRR